jgi:hypothetical protein
MGQHFLENALIHETACSKEEKYENVSQTADDRCSGVGERARDGLPHGRASGAARTAWAGRARARAPTVTARVGTVFAKGISNG